MNFHIVDPEETGAGARRSPVPVWLALPAAAGLIALVALASRPTSSGSGPTAIDLGPALTAIEVVGYVGLAVGVVALVIGLAINRGRPRRLKAGGPIRSKELAPVPWWSNLIGLAAMGTMLAIQVIVIISFIEDLRRRAEAAANADGGLIPGLDPNALGPADRDLVSLTIALVIVTALGVGVLVVAVRARLDRARQPDMEPGDRSATTVAAVELSLDALRGDPDPRRAVIAAYAAMERSLSGAGFGRRRSEAPFEYLRRVLATSISSADEVRTLTVLFQHARFSHHAVDETMRAGAIDALEQLRSTAGGTA